MRNSNPTPTAAQQAVAWASLAANPQPNFWLTRTQVAALLGVNPTSVAHYEQSGQLRRFGERPAVYDCRDFQSALRYLVNKGLLKKAAELGKAAKRGPKPRNV